MLPTTPDFATVLVVDDNEYSQELLTRLLTRLGHQVATANNGQQALELLGEYPCDLVLLDVMMPEMDGYQVLERLKADGKLHQLPVVMVSALDDLSSIVKCIELGADDYLFKPYNPVLLQARLQALLEKKRLRERETAYQAQVLAAQKMASLGTLAAGVAHEMNSPLQVVTGMCATLIGDIRAGDLDPQRLAQTAEIIQRNAWRCAQVTAALRSYAQPRAGPLAAHSLDALVHDALVLADSHLHTPALGPLAVETDLQAAPAELECDRNQIVQALISLLTNARDAMPGGGTLTVRTRYLAGPHQFQVEVTDTGPGIAEDILPRIFDPFFTTKPIGQGSGLGLAVLSSIVQAHRGQVEVKSAPGQGTTFALLLPEKAPAPGAPARPKAPGRFDDSLPETPAQG